MSKQGYYHGRSSSSSSLKIVAEIVGKVQFSNYLGTWQFRRIYKFGGSVRLRHKRVSIHYSDKAVGSIILCCRSNNVILGRDARNSLDVNCRNSGSRLPFGTDRICIVHPPMVFFAVGGVKMTLRQRFTWQRTTWQARKYVRNYSWKRDMGRSRLTVAVAHRYTLKEHRMSHKYGYVSTHTVRLDNRFIMDRLRYIIQGRDLSLENGGDHQKPRRWKKFLQPRGYRLRH